MPGICRLTASWTCCTSRQAKRWPTLARGRLVYGARGPARRAGGHVVAEDINAPYLEEIRERAATEKLTNIDPVLGTPDDPKLTPNSLDAALMLKVYHEIAHPAVLLGHLRQALKPGARFGIIDRNGTGEDHGLNEKIVRDEVERNGFRQGGPLRLHQGRRPGLLSDL